MRYKKSSTTANAYIQCLQLLGKKKTKWRDDIHTCKVSVLHIQKEFLENTNGECAPSVFPNKSDLLFQLRKKWCLKRWKLKKIFWNIIVNAFLNTDMKGINIQYKHTNSVADNVFVCPPNSYISWRYVHAKTNSKKKYFKARSEWACVWGQQARWLLNKLDLYAK